MFSFTFFFLNVSNCIFVKQQQHNQYFKTAQNFLYIYIYLFHHKNTGKIKRSALYTLYRMLFLFFKFIIDTCFYQLYHKVKLENELGEYRGLVPQNTINVVENREKYAQFLITGHRFRRILMKKATIQDPAGLFHTNSL